MKRNCTSTRLLTTTEAAREGFLRPQQGVVAKKGEPRYIKGYFILL
jgi:hypothetical protein